MHFVAESESDTSLADAAVTNCYLDQSFNELCTVRVEDVTLILQNVFSPIG